MKVYTVCCALLLSIILFMLPVSADDLIENEPFTSTFKTNGDNLLKPLNINAGSAIVVEMESGRVIYEKDAYRKRSIASTTKIMTAVIALENGRLDEKVSVSKRAASIHGSQLKLKAGSQYTLKELLYGMMLESGNDAAIAIAEHIGGSVERFAEMMTGKAIEIGAKDTCFKTPHGLDAVGHYSTAFDLALITRYALNNPIFSEIVKTKTSAIPGISLSNTNEMLTSYPGADGVKTGYTGDAGRCLVTSATRDGMRLISVVLYCPTRYARASSSAKILNYAFNNYKKHVLVKNGESAGKITILKGTRKSMDTAASEAVVLPLTDAELERLERKIYLPEKIKAPVRKNDQIGSIEYLLDGQLLAWTPVVSAEDVERKGFTDYLSDWLRMWTRIMREGIFCDMDI